MKKEVKDQGCYEDFIECLKLYDKAENGFMLAGELIHSLLALGQQSVYYLSLIVIIIVILFICRLAEKLTDAEGDVLFEDCLDEENDEGEIPYIRKCCA